MPSWHRLRKKYHYDEFTSIFLLICSENNDINVAGEEVPAIGTDFDGFTDPPDEIIHMGQLPRITSHLKAVGWDDLTVSKFLGDNSLRLIRNGWKK